MENLEKLKTFNERSLPDLDIVVLGALELFLSKEIPKLDIPFEKPLVIGSEGALATGRILFNDRCAVFANESNYNEVIDRSDINGVVLISASGGKHAEMIAGVLQKKDVKKILLTNNPEAPASEFFESNNIYVLPKNREPYTYNTSTYLGMILAINGGSVDSIINVIKNEVEGQMSIDFAKYKNFTFILPKEFILLSEHVRIKFEELFVPIVWGRSYTEEEIKHAKTVVHANNELFISINVDNKDYGDIDNRLHLQVSDENSYALMMSVLYYVIGRIQAAHPPYFKEGIEEYVKKASEIFDREINIIVE